MNWHTAPLTWKQFSDFFQFFYQHSEDIYVYLSFCCEFLLWIYANKHKVNEMASLCINMTSDCLTVKLMQASNLGESGTDYLQWGRGPSKGLKQKCCFHYFFKFLSNYCHNCLKIGRISWMRDFTLYKNKIVEAVWGPSPPSQYIMVQSTPAAAGAGAGAVAGAGAEDVSKQLNEQIGCCPSTHVNIMTW